MSTKTVAIVAVILIVFAVSLIVNQVVKGCAKDTISTKDAGLTPQDVEQMTDEQKAERQAEMLKAENNQPPPGMAKGR